MDLNPFLPVGIDASTARFLDVFLLHCLLAESPPDTPDEIAALARNQHRTAARGREPGIQLERGGALVSLADWGAEIIAACRPIADAVDAAHDGMAYREAIEAAAAAWAAPATLPSARVVEAMVRDHASSYTAFVDTLSQRTRAALLDVPLAPGAEAHYAQLAKQSVDAQREIEAGDTMPFEIYRQEYLAPRRLRV
jgi:glutamate--cysteine ligase